MDLLKEENEVQKNVLDNKMPMISFFVENEEWDVNGVLT